MNPEGIFFVPEMSTDERVRVFRRSLGVMEDFSGMEVDAYAIITERYVVVCDTMLCPEDAAVMMQMVQGELTGRELLVVNSHADWDHVWGNRYFTSEHAAPIIAHEHSLVRLQSGESREELEDFQQRYPVFRSVTLVPPTITFERRLTIHGGDLSIELIPAPGHHLDHIAAWIPQLRLLLAFDAAEMPFPIIEDAAAVPLMYSTLESLIALQPERVLCSHGKTTSPELVIGNLAYLREVERRCEAFIQTHQVTDAEMERAAELIDYPLEEVIAGKGGEIDRKFYGWAHENDVRCIMEWLKREHTAVR